MFRCRLCAWPRSARTRSGRNLGRTGSVFTTTRGTPIDPRNVNRWFDELCERAGVRRLRGHDLRHMCASLLLALGVPTRVVMETLGHSRIAATMDLYTHVLAGVQEIAATEMDRALGGGSGYRWGYAGPKRPQERRQSRRTGQVLRAWRDSNPQPSDP